MESKKRKLPVFSELQSKKVIAVWLIVCVILGCQWVVASWSLKTESPTIDEVLHLPAGITYWETGKFRLYHHNPPLVKLLAARTVLGSMDARKQEQLYQSRYWTDEPPNKAGFGHDFAKLYADSFFEIFMRARLLMPLFLVTGGLFVFLWSKSIYGNNGGLLSLCLWAVSPNLLAHGRLITTDVASAAMGTAATFLFVKYLRNPRTSTACFAGIALGLSLITKFSLLVLVFLWPVIWLLKIWLVKSDKSSKFILLQSAKHAVVVALTSLLVVNTGYLFDGTGKKLGSFEFYSQTLTRELPANRPRLHQTGNSLLDLLGSRRVNRFKDSVIGYLPCPLPADFMTGFDDQKIDAEGVPARYLRPDDPSVGNGEVEGYPVYLNGRIRNSGWWYYYPYAFLIKTPPGTLILIGLSVVALVIVKKSGSAWFEESATLVVPVSMIMAMTFLTNINIGLRYILPALPYLFIGCGRLAPAFERISGKTRVVGFTGLVSCIVWSGLSTASVAPHFLAYFNSIGGGPDRGHEHLIDSNLDWGQDLVGLKAWLDQNAPGEPVGIAYFGQINPDIYRLRNQPLDWFLPPSRPESVMPLPPGRAGGPLRPGLYALSASLVHGLPWRVYDVSRWAPYDGKEGAFDYFLKTEPIAKIGWSIFIYRIDENTAKVLESERLRTKDR